LNCCRDRSRLKRSAHICELSSELEQCIPAPDDGLCRVESAELAGAINGFLATLEVEKRNIFLRRYWFLDTIPAISQRYGYSESKIKSVLFRIRNKLRMYLQKEGYEL
jgi:RNA polymerase sigma-70 factor (ECF subfamily)